MLYSFLDRVEGHSCFFRPDFDINSMVGLVVTIDDSDDKGVCLFDTWKFVKSMTDIM
jgi:hypothetical protein